MEHIHMIGIGGTGLSAIARVLLDQGYQVSGSDLAPSDLFDAVGQAGGVVYQGHKAEQVRGADLVIQSSAVPETNVEVVAARRAGIPVLKRSQFLERLMSDKQVLAVAGTHGKTTTTSMLAWILSNLGLDPSYIVGGVVSNLGRNAAAGSGRQFVIEADEYDYMFHGLSPDIAVVTNLEYDHPDIFPSPQVFRQAFEDFVANLSQEGILILCEEDPAALSLQSGLQKGQTALSYGFKEGADYQARELSQLGAEGLAFELKVKNTDSDPVRISLGLSGKHNVLNALAAFVVGDCLSLDHKDMARALSQFRGSERRFEIRGEFRGVLLVDDYGHHPTELEATLQGARESFPDRRIWAVWQPHTYSRTQALYPAFAAAFSEADEVVVLDVYPAREKKPEDFQLEEVVSGISHPSVKHLPGLEKAADEILKELMEGDLVVVFSAGDAIEISARLERALSASIEQQ